MQMVTNNSLPEETPQPTMSFFINEQDKQMNSEVRKIKGQNNIFGNQQRAKTSEMKKRGGMRSKLNESALNNDIKDAHPSEGISQHFESR
jgi:hypothetical protein